MVANEALHYLEKEEPIKMKSMMRRTGLGIMVLIVLPFIVWGANPQSLVTQISLGKELRNDYNGFVGMKIKVGDKDIQVTELGRYFKVSNNQSHDLKIFDLKTNQVLASVSLDMAKGKADNLGFKYASLKQPVTLKAGMEYAVMSQETLNGDKWYGRTAGHMPRLTMTGAVKILAQIYGEKPPFKQASVADNQCYGPLNFKYIVSSK